MKKIIIIGLLTLIVSLVGYFYINFNYPYSEGYRSGVVQKISKKGFIFKTYEGELVLIGNNVSFEKFVFSIKNDSIANVMTSMEGKKVMLHYTQTIGKLSFFGDTNYFIDGVQMIQQ